MLTTKNLVGCRLVLSGLILALTLTACAPPGARALRDGDRRIRQGQPKAAVEKLRVAVQLLPTNALAWNQLGLAYHLAQMPQPAAQAYQRALMLDPNLAVANYNLGCLQLEQNHLPGAIASLTTFTLQRPAAPEGKLKLGTAYLRARHWEAAERSFREVVAHPAQSAEALNGLGIIQTQRRRYVEARNHFAAALQHQARYGPALLNLAILSHQHLNQKSYALEKYREYATLNPHAPARAQIMDTIRQLETELQPAAPVVAVTPPVPVDPHPAAAWSRLTNVLGRVTPTNQSRAGLPLPVVPAEAAVVASSEGRSEPQAAPAVRSPAPPPIPDPSPAGRSPSAPAPATERPKVVAEEPPFPAPAVVMVNDDPLSTKPPQIESAPSSLTPPVMASPDSSGSTAAPPSTTNATLAVVSLPARTGEEERPSRSLIQRLNPKNWFGGGGRERRTTPLGEPDARAVSVVPASTASNAASATVSAAPVRGSATTNVLQTALLPPASDGARAPATPLPAQPRAQRYTYLRPSPPQPGDRRSAQSAFEAGLSAQKASDYVGAAAEFQRSAAQDPAFFDAHHNLALARYELGDLAPALASFETALAIQPASTAARYNFALALRRAGYPADAANELERLLADHADFTPGHFTLAGIYAQQLYRKDKARSHYLRVLEQDPSHPSAQSIRVWLGENL
jgi:tetratricopeptide (TPR) repeat protein